MMRNASSEDCVDYEELHVPSDTIIPHTDDEMNAHSTLNLKFRSQNVWKSVKLGAGTVKSRTKAAAGKAREVAQAQMSVFGAAPSLAVMKNLNQQTHGSKTMFQGAEFWYRFRQYYFYVFPLMFVVALILATTAWNTERGHVCLGALLSFVSCVAVCASYIMILPWRRHPSTIVFYRAATNILFSFIVICMAVYYEANPTIDCNSYSVSVEFALIAGECWLTTIALDLVFSLTNPFTSYKGNMRRYHSMTWCFALLISFVLYNQPSCQGRFEGGVCWVSGSGCLMGYYVFWIILMYCFQFGAVIFAHLRLRKGLPATFEIRLKIAIETFKLLALYCVYLVIVCIFFIVLSSEPDNPENPKSWSNFRNVFNFIVSCRGFVDGVVWFMQHEFAVDEKVVVVESASGDEAEEDRQVRVKGTESSDDSERRDDVDLESGGLRRRQPARRRSSSDSTSMRRPTMTLLADNIADAIKDLAEITAYEFDEADLSPQVNLALRQQIVKYVTMGVTRAAEEGMKNKRIVPTDPWGKAMKACMEAYREYFSPHDPMKEQLQVTEFLLDGEHPFQAFAQDYFEEIRRFEGIDEGAYLEALQHTEKEQLSEGASGAFMFFCGGGDYIVKTIRAHEANVLHRSLPMYKDYLKENPSSLLVRFLGSYSLKVYAQTFSFVVMRNIFEPGVDINERYDIKGSWVNRSAAAPMPNKRIVCRHCNEMFLPSARAQCTKIVGTHEANVVLKDNDLRTKISLRQEDARAVLEIIKKDSNLLADMGVLDYSLIVGVKKRNFEIGQEEQRPVRPKSRGKGKNGVENNKRYASFNAKSVSGPAIYYMGIVDYLQDWSNKKKIERAAKIYLTRHDPAGVSVMEPLPYRDRFQDKMDHIFDMSPGGDSDGETHRVSLRRSSNSMNTRIDHHHRMHPITGSPPSSPTAGGKVTTYTTVDDNSSGVVNVLHQGKSITLKGTVLSTEPGQSDDDDYAKL
mmetsp:Transcript_15359/g.23119  ORF Transcript_15359/g.23119 Transcript_15359/m.23119 type:complete len:971 (+) Transcript_15359:26-2938(+)|eukprot:CAMPEP_0185039504 /NCGR_PEP_ID=MMETSP1103-20130426/36406_1 /TAXON_ID=36769 /ORGANISM="Paraphysomonas bandaiensis, Strain Caron Lab Isolate" /LENGTH=970 /DNA_ID=CAMNT_0027578409 /DNA_START=1 /DNA_END=2913 /DNA_ORIENTATION=-